MKKNLLTMLFSGLLLGCASKENAQAEIISTEEVRNEQQEAAVDYYPFQTQEGGKWGLISPKGEVLFSEKFDGELSHAVRGRFWAFDEASTTYQLYTAEKNPKLVSKKRYRFVTDFFHEVTPVAEEKGKIQFIDINGKVKYTFDQVDGRDVETCGNFIHGVAVFKTEDELYGLVNMKGQVVAAPKYFYISTIDLKTGLAVAASNDHKHTFMAESEWFNSAQTPIVDILGPEGIIHKDMKLDRFSEYSIDLMGGRSVQSD